MVSLRADGTIAVLCPGGDDTLAGVAVMTVALDEAEEIMAGDPCVQAGMIRAEVHPGAGFPGDTVPGEGAPRGRSLETTPHSTAD